MTSQKPSLKRLGNQFPRTTTMPVQSPQYWVKEKDRHLRQLLISDIQEETKRALIVYYMRDVESIANKDSDDLVEILRAVTSNEVDILLQTSGGTVDAVEKVIKVLQKRISSYRVIVPGWAKSGGTLIALSSEEILMGLNSELGPIDSQFGGIPAEFIAADPAVGATMQAMANQAIDRTKQLAKYFLQNGMKNGTTEKEIDDLVEKLTSTNSYKSHGAVIDADEAKNLELNVSEMDDLLWNKVWTLYLMYEHDALSNGYGKMFEGEQYSVSRILTPQK